MDIFTVAVYALWVYLFYLGLKELPKLPDHIRSLKDGKKALWYLPVSYAVLLIMLGVASDLANMFPILQWGWLGTNIAVAPLIDMAGLTTEGGGLSTIAMIGVVFFGAALIYLCITANFIEEYLFRGSWTLVVIWALLHLLMGIPIYAVIPIFSVGIVYKYVYDKYTVDHSYCLHFFTNAGLIALVLIGILMG
jgi:membrane protease YdiL (CAAX protease family)